MSVSIADALAVIQERAAAQITTMPLLWPDEDHVLPDKPAPFVFFDVIADRSDVIEIGGGRATNRHRHRAELNAYVFAPRGTGLAYVLSLAEPVAAAFRRYASGGVKFDGATVHPVGEGAALVPPGLNSAAGNYACAVVSAPFLFDQTT